MNRIEELKIWNQVYDSLLSVPDKLRTEYWDLYMIEVKRTIQDLEFALGIASTFDDDMIEDIIY